MGMSILTLAGAMFLLPMIIMIPAHLILGEVPRPHVHHRSMDHATGHIPGRSGRILHYKRRIRPPPHPHQKTPTPSQSSKITGDTATGFRTCRDCDGQERTPQGLGTHPHCNHHHAGHDLPHQDQQPEHRSQAEHRSKPERCPGGWRGDCPTNLTHPGLPATGIRRRPDPHPDRVRGTSSAPTAPGSRWASCPR